MGHIWTIVADVTSFLFVVACFLYLGYRSLKNSEDPPALVVRWLITVGIAIGGYFLLSRCPPQYVPVVAAVIGICLAIVWASTIAATFGGLVSSMFDGGREEIERKPLYSYAETKRHNGLPHEAVHEVRKQLFLFPNDLTGILLLASIQAEDLKDLPAAEATVNEFIAQPDRTPQVVSAALQNLADLQWKCGQGAAVAAATLQRIVDAYPDTPFAHAALQRIAHFDSADATRREREEIHRELLEGERDVGLRSGAVKITPKAAGPAEQADELVSQLERYPMDVESRERLALLYAQELGRVDLAVDQLEQLIALTAESPRHIAQWLNQLATVHARFGGNLAGAQQALRRLIERFPKSGMAEAAATRLASIATEVQGSKVTASKTIGSYEKQIGLKKKYGPPDPASI